jgi:hypothetical protein
LTQVSDDNKNLKNTSTAVSALRAFVLMSKLCACKQAYCHRALPSSPVASQLKTSSEAKTIKTISFVHKPSGIEQIVFSVFATHDG